MVAKLSTFLYPNVCLYCDDIGHAGLDLCHSCYNELPWNTRACRRCALPLQTNNAAVCGACSNRNIYFEQAFTPFIFEHFVKKAVYQFKFNSKLNYGKLLAQLLTHYIQKHNVVIPDTLIPVPLHGRRLRKRGFNQALEIARIVGRHVGCAISFKDVRRARETRVQMELSANNRYANVKNAFMLQTSKPSFTGQHVAIVDDVMTTGNTVNEVARCVKKAGAKRVDVWCIARVA